MIDKDAKNIIENNPVALATVNEDNTPNVIGVAYVKVVSNDELLITDNFMGQTKDNILTNPNICLATWDKDWNGYKVTGKASYHTDGKWKKYVQDMPENEGLSAKGAVIIKANQVKKLG